MIHISKQAEPEAFATWKATYPHALYKDLGRDRLFPGAQQARWALRASLVAEQKGLCCYCEARIDNGDFHVEHFRPKGHGLFPHLQLEYGNMHACCRKSATGGDEEYCGHKKENTFSEQLVSPLEPDCESHFEYDLTGGISGTDERGTETVSLLNLDSTLLRRRREGLIQEFEDMDADEFDAEIALHIDRERVPLGEFLTAIEYLYDKGLLKPLG